MEKRYLAWKDIEEAVRVIAEWAKSKDLKYITGPARGGLIPAVLLSHQTGLKYTSLATSRTHPEIMRAKTLLIDDICDSGKTFEELDDWGFATASLYWRNTSTYRPDKYAVKLANEDWIVFPWEKEDSETIQDYLK